LNLASVMFTEELRKPQKNALTCRIFTCLKGYVAFATLVMPHVFVKQWKQ